MEPTQITLSNHSFTVGTSFNASSYDPNNVGSNAAEQVYGIQSGQLSYSSDVAENLVVQRLDPPAGPTVSTYTADVQGFSTNLDCEILQLKNATKTFLPWFSIQAPYFVVNITTDSCHIINAIVGQGADHGYYRDNNVTENYQGLFQNLACNTGDDSSAQHPIKGNSSSDLRVLLSTAHLQWTPHLPVQEASSIWVKNLTAILCKPTYSINNYAVTYDQSETSLKMQAVKKPALGSTLPGFDDSMLLDAVRATFRNRTYGQGGVDYVVVQVPPFFQVMKAILNASSIAPLMDPQLLRDLGSRVYQGASIQIARENLLVPQNSSTNGALTYTEDRLQVQRLTVGLMTTCLGLLVCISILEIFVRPWDVVSCEPNSISAFSRILAASESLKQRLGGTGSATLDALKRRLSQGRFQTVIVEQKTTSFVLESVPDSPEMAKSSTSNLTEVEMQWWHPIAVKSWFTALIVVLPLCLIAILEALQHASDSRDGFVDVTSSKLRSQILSTYLPALVTLILGLLYSSLDSAVSIFAPLAALRRGKVPAARSIMVDSIGGLPPITLVKSLRGRHFARCLIIIGSFVASLLTVAVSALYSVEIVQNTRMVSLQQADFFNWTHVDLSQDDAFAGAIANLLTHSNTSYPQWTYDNLVLPALTTHPIRVSAPSNDSKSLVVKIPAIRASLSNCSAVPPHSINVTARGALPTCTNCNNLVQLDYIMTVPYSLCGIDSKNYITATWSQTYVTPNDSSTVYAGKGTALQWYVPDAEGGSVIGDGGVILNDPRDAVAYDYNVDNFMPGCPSFSYSLGMISAGHAFKKFHTDNIDGMPWTSKQNITVMYCYQQLEQVITNVTFSYPDFKINSTKPPIPLEETATVITQNNTKYWFDISLNTFINSLEELPVRIKGHNDINGFIQTLVYGHNGLPLDQLYNNGNLSTLKAAANHLYGQYTAQAISNNMRTSVAPGNTINTSPTTTYNIAQNPVNYPATLHHSSQRLRQNKGPKIVLQAMLAFLAACALATYLSMDTKSVVPHNPCSIAGMMSLLADSEMCRSRDVIPPGAEWMGTRELRQEGVFKGYLFRMGWWDGLQGGEVQLGEEGEKGGNFAIDVAGKRDRG